MPASGRSEAEAARSTREGVGRRAKRRRPTRLGRREAAVLSGRAGLKGGSREAGAGDASTATRER
ncbi:hypothetical protein EXE44_08720 [Halorubrum sp. SS7]|nr:hypothetical protein EXE44_08720 [Halorubrum sp. SS7]